MGTDWYAGEVERVKQFLKGENGDVILQSLEEAMKAAAIEMDYEQAAIYRDHHELVTLLLEKQKCIAAPVLEHNAVVIDRSIQDGHCRLLFVRHGRLIDSLKCSLTALDEEREAYVNSMRKHFGEENERPERYYKAEIEDIRLLAHWLYVNREASKKIDWLPEVKLEALIDEVWEHVEMLAQG